jgi:signal transduction histidine kinase/ActR/RegA family two-component response regulator
MPKKRPEGKQTFRYKSALIFAMTSVLPLLMFLFIMEEYGLIQERKVSLLMALGVAIAVMGFFFFMRIVKQVNKLARDFIRIERGEISRLGESEAAAEFTEMARIADAFNNTLDDLKSHTKELENLVEKLTTLSELTELVARIPNIKEVLQMVLHRTMAAVNAKIGSIMLLDEKSQTLSITASVGLDDSIVTETTVRVGEGIAGKVAQTGEPLLVEDMEHDPRFHKTNNPKYDSSSFICMPLQAQFRTMGVLNLSKRGDRRSFTSSDLKFLTTLLGHIGFALENARLLKEAKEAALKLQQVVNDQSQELDQARQQVLQTVKLSALGELIAGVAHELNNPLTTVIGRSELMLQDIQDENVRKNLEKILDQGQRASKIVKNLLSFARQKPPEKRPCNINDIFNMVMEMRGYDLKMSNIEVKTELNPDLPNIMADTTQLEQVFLNIVNNAHQAMAAQDRPGTLTVSTRLDGDKFKIEFNDTGPGISPENVERIFDPFFTTKAESKGTGLGLSISYGIVKAHDGDIYVRSKLGEGTTFIVELPLITQEDILTGDETHQEDETGKLTTIQKVLVIDDEDTVNDLITEILVKEGYQVDSVNAGDTGFQKLQEDNEYDIILCDMRMPGMDGQQLYTSVKEKQPHIAQRFIFLTGDIVSQDTRDFLKETGNRYITKPFTKDVLLDAVKEAWEQIALSKRG